MKQILCLLMAALLLGTLCACAAAPRSAVSSGNALDISFEGATPEHVFRYAENQAADYPTTLGAYEFARLVDEATGGRIKIKVYPSAELGDERSVIEQMQYGGIDFTRASFGTLAEFSPELNVLQLPYLYRDDAHMQAVLSGDIGTDYLHNKMPSGVVGLSWYNAGARSFYSAKRISSLKDLEGQTIRIQSSAIMVEIIQALGATPTQIVFSEVYAAFRTGEIDSAENNMPSYESEGHNEVAPYFMVDEHMRVPEVQLISEKALAKLSQDDIEILRDCAQKSAVYEHEQWALREEVASQNVREAGAEIITFPEWEKQKFRSICHQLYEKYSGGNMDIVNQIIAIKS